MLRDSLLSENVLALTAQENGVTVGYAMAFASGDEADIVNLAVMPEYRRRGIGRALLQMLLWHLRQAGVKSSFLEVRSSNEKAKELYISEGFSEIGVRRNYYNKPKENALVMFSDLTK